MLEIAQPNVEQQNSYDAEQQYLDKTGIDGLQARYDQVSYAEFQQEILQYARPVGSREATQLPRIEALMQRRVFDQASRKAIDIVVQHEIDRLFAADTDKESGRNNKEKHAVLVDHVQRYLNLISEAQQQGDIPRDVAASDILHLVLDNVYTLAYQDKVASSNNLGDHGIRHLVKHNIAMVEKALDSLRQQGQEVKAIDYLVGHQVMDDHDGGYAMHPVRTAVDAGNVKADRGHNVLAAKAHRERTKAGTDALSKVLGKSAIDRIHRGILYHDSTDIQFVIDQNPNSPQNAEQNRFANVDAAIHLADNTHAFEDKLPEILYNYPQSLATLRMLKIAGEIGDQSLVDALKRQLQQQIDANTDLAADDKNALKQAVSGMSAEGYKFVVGRICGNKPEVAIDSSGKVSITVTESAIHQEVVQQFDRAAYDQLAKLVQDLTGQPKDTVMKELAAGKTSFQNADGTVAINVKIGEAKAQEKTDYQQRVAELLKDPQLVHAVSQDALLSARQATLEALLNDSTVSQEMQKEFRKQLDVTKNARAKLVKQYIEQKQIN